jgi:hypothetical protein
MSLYKSAVLWLERFDTVEASFEELDRIMDELNTSLIPQTHELIKSYANFVELDEHRKDDEILEFLNKFKDQLQTKATHFLKIANTIQYATEEVQEKSPGEPFVIDDVIDCLTDKARRRKF